MNEIYPSRSALPENPLRWFIIGAGFGLLLVANLASGIAMLLQFPALTSIGMLGSATLLGFAAASVYLAAAMRLTSKNH